MYQKRRHNPGDFECFSFVFVKSFALWATISGLLINAGVFENPKFMALFAVLAYFVHCVKFEKE